jgi:Fis family transcriptional regulator, factor for inversion stimulation protein
MQQNQTTLPLNHHVKNSIKQYFSNFEIIEPQNIVNLYNLVISEVEKPLLETVLEYTNSNQSQAAKLLGLSRNTLRKLIAKYSIC